MEFRFQASRWLFARSPITTLTRLLIASVLWLGCALGVHARQPQVAIVIDDLGYRPAQDIRALELPGALTYAILPNSPHGARVARLAYQRRKEVIVHMPMEGHSAGTLGAGGLTVTLPRERFVTRLRTALDSVPHAIGMSNHMGSRLSELPRQMGWVMEELAERNDWLFLDSRTTAATVAADTARAYGVRVTSRDVFLDHHRDLPSVAQRIRDLIAEAKSKGTAVGIGHPHPETLESLQGALPTLTRLGVELVPLSQVVRRQMSQMPAAAASAQLLSSGHAVITR